MTTDQAAALNAHAMPDSHAQSLLPAEQAMLRDFERQRRLSLLRIVVPALLIVALLALPTAIFSDWGSRVPTSTIQISIALVGFVVAFFAMRLGRVNLSSLFLIAGVLGVILDLVFTDGPMSGSLDLNVLPELQLLLLPIVMAGLFGGPPLVIGTTSLAMATTLSIILLTPHGPALANLMSRPDGLVVFTVPLALQIAVCALMIAGMAMLRRTIRELSDVRVAHARSQELDRMKDHFIASVNHELRTPIMALQGYVALAQELGKRGNTERQHHMLARSAEAADHLGKLVKSVLNVRHIEADIGSMELATFELYPTIIEASGLLDPTEAGPVERELHISVAKHLTAFGDRERVKQVLVNLLSNAGKYSPPGSPVEISTREIIQQARHGRSTGAVVEVTVRDYGAGVPPEQAIHLFQRFVRLERDIASPVSGTGLGLAICRTYIEKMGGQIWVESSGVSGEGSRFIFTLPADEHSSQADRSRQAQSG